MFNRGGCKVDDAVAVVETTCVLDENATVAVELVDTTTSGACTCRPSPAVQI